MKTLISTLFVAAHLLPAIASANPVEVPSPVHKVFVPEGFDDNDNVEVTLHGEFPTTCYQVGRTSYKVDEASREITLWAVSLQYPGEACKDVQVPFTQTVKLGLLTQGTYKIVVKQEAPLESSISVARRNVEAAEDYLYAPVFTASLAKAPNGAKQNLILAGEYPYMFIGCMVINEVRTQLTAGNVLVVQPISKIEDDATEACQKQVNDKAFKVSTDLAVPLQGEGLIHVRVLNGDSINQFVPAQ